MHLVKIVYLTLILPLLFVFVLGQLRTWEWQPACDSAAGVRCDPVPERYQVGSPELGRQWPQAAFQESLQTSPSWRDVHPGATAMGVLREEEEADGKKLRWLWFTSWAHS